MRKAIPSFLKLCKVKYYNYSPIFGVQRDFSFQTGDPIGPDSKDSDGGTCIWGLLSPSKPRTFIAEVNLKFKHKERGTVSFATTQAKTDSDERLAGSQFIITLGDNLDYLDGKAAVFGRVVEGFDALEAINGAFVDGNGRPLKDIRIRHTVILDDPFPDPPGLVEPDTSPVPSAAQLATVRIADDEELGVEEDQEALEKLRREREAKAQALTLEMVGDLPFAEVKPPENILFVCKLNPVTASEDLELIFGRFGTILSCEIIKDKKTGDSLQYAFIEFEKQEQCEMAYSKMQDVLIDDHRIHVDFSQSVSKLSQHWRDGENSKRKMRGGGWGGIRDLEKRRKYRGEDDTERKSDGKYELVFDKHNKDRESKRKHSRSRSPRGDRRRYGNDRPRDDERRDRSRDRNRDYGRRH